MEVGKLQYAEGKEPVALRPTMHQIFLPPFSYHKLHIEVGKWR